LNERLTEFEASRGSYVQTRQSQQKIVKEALNLLTMFGDSVGGLQTEHLQAKIDQGERLSNLTDSASRLNLYSHKHRGVYLYAFRILRPIWRMKITNYVSTQKLDLQQLNRDQMIPALERLQNLMRFIVNNEQALVG